ncbi:MAG TPA: arginyltransferase [Rhodospirillaceae bacterium]|nr:arginyltransferase [Rhodospirillaceae bacterium]
MATTRAGEKLPFFLSGEDACPYWMDRPEQKLFTKLTGDSDADNAMNAILTAAGFRRSMDILYRPYCPNCRACVPVRLNQTLFSPSRSQKKLMKRNSDLTVESVPARATPSLYDLFRSYIYTRHGESDMAQMNWLEFQTMIEGGVTSKFLLVVRAPSPRRVVGCMLVDDVGNGLSAVYSFFDPKETRRSLGTQLILLLIDEARRQDKQWVYLGYWIEGLQKMAYKAAFKPLERIQSDAPKRKA